MPIYHRKKEKIHFIHIPKCAGTSVSSLLINNGWKKEDLVIPEKYKNEIFNSKNTSKHIHRKIWKDININADFTFTTVRNPYDRFYSEVGWVLKGLNIKASDMRSDYSVLIFNKLYNENFKNGNSGIDNNHWRPQSEFVDKSVSVFKIESELEKMIETLQKKGYITKNCTLERHNVGKPDKVLRCLHYSMFKNVHKKFLNYYRDDFFNFSYKVL